MLQFDDSAYQYFPPNLSKFWVSVFRAWNRFVYLPGNVHRIKSVVVTNAEVLNYIRKERSCRILFLPNHSTHSDPQVMMEVLRKVGIYSQFMAAYDVFKRNKFYAWIMQRSGVFSVDRQGSDSKSMKQAIKTLVDGEYALTIFPEGNVYFTNDKVTPFLEGAAYMAMKAQKEIGNNETIYAVPTSLKFTHLSDQRNVVLEKLKSLAEEVGVGINDNSNMVDEVKRVGIALLVKNLEKQGYVIPDADPGDVLSFIKKAAEIIIVELENKLRIKTASGGELMARIQKINRLIHQIQINPEKKQEYPDILSWSDQAILAYRILTYSGTYLESCPSIDRFGESVEKLLEDAYSKAVLPYGDRAVYAQFNQPIPLVNYLDRFQTSSRETLQTLTCDIESSVQKGLDGLRERNLHPGGELFV